MGNEQSRQNVSESGAKQLLSNIMEYKPVEGPAVEVHLSVAKAADVPLWAYKIRYSYERAPAYASILGTARSKESVSEELFDSPAQALYAGHGDFTKFASKNDLAFYPISVAKHNKIRYESHNMSTVEDLVKEVISAPRQDAVSFAGKGVAKEKCLNAWQTLKNKPYGNANVRRLSENFVKLIESAFDDQQFLLNILNSPDPAVVSTVFVPVDTAVNKFKQENPEFIGNKKAIKQLVYGHILVGSVAVGDVPTKKTLYETFSPTREPTYVNIERVTSLTGKKILVIKGIKTTVVKSVETLNGYVHLIDAVITGGLTSTEKSPEDSPPAPTNYGTMPQYGQVPVAPSVPSEPSDVSDHYRAPPKPPPMVGTYNSVPKE